MPNYQLNNRVGTRYLILAVCFLFLFGAGFYGYSEVQNQSFMASLYLTLQLLVLNGPGTELSSTPWQIQLSALGLPIFTIGTFLITAFRIIGLQSSIIRLQFCPKQHVFLGIGKVPASIIDTFKDRQDFSAVAIDKNVKSYRINLIKNTKNVLVLEHEIDDIKFLSKLRLDKASHIYLFTGDDLQNINIARKIINIISSKKTKAQPNLFINVESRMLLDTVSREHEFADYHRKCAGDRKGNINWFSSNQQSALALLQKYPPRLELIKDKSITDENIHIAIIGQPACIDEFVLNLIKQCAMMVNGKFYVSLFGTSQACFHDFIAKHEVLSSNNKGYGGYLEGIKICFFQISENGVDPDAIKNAHIEQNETPIDTFYVFGDSDYNAMNTALRLSQVAISMSDNPNIFRPIQSGSEPSLRNHLPRVVIRLPGDHHTACPSENEKWDSLEHADWFHSIRDIFVVENEAFPGETIQRMAKSVNSAYRGAKDDSKTQDSEWAELPEFKKISSIQSAEHIFIKLRSLGFQLIPDSSKSSPDESALNHLKDVLNKNEDSLIEIEHKRFVIERVIDDWLTTPKWLGENESEKLKETLKELRLNETLVRSDELCIDEVSKDQRIVSVISEVLSSEAVRSRYKVEKL